MTNEEQYQLADKVKEACVQAAKEGFQDASISGLCTEGAMEAAVGAIQKLDIQKILDKKS
ncbi:MAG: acetyltransferase [Bacteroidetes bacterium]|jgi:hypothetical protein|nr:acetyltransferase [Bacteroidota bacterium]